MTTRLVVLSCAEHDDGSYSQEMASLDGITGRRAEPRAVFKAWVSMAMQLAQLEGLDPGRAAIAEEAMDLVLTRLRERS